MMEKPLQGIKVLDLSRLLPGPVTTLHLADLGADVIKVEDNKQGDYARWMGAVKKTTSGYFLAVNRNKRGITLDLKSKEGVETFLHLARDADVIVESFRPGVVDHLGIGYEQVKAVNPSIVYCAITGYGQDGPYRDKAGHDLNYCGYSGITSQLGEAGGPPVMSNFQIADLAGGSLSAVMGILAALLSVQRGGPGRYVDVSMTDCAMSHAVVALMEYGALGKTSERGEGFLTGDVPGYGIYATRDGRYMGVGALEPKFWALLCRTIDRPEWATYEQTVEGKAAMRQAVADLFLTKDQSEWTALFDDVDCCVGPILTLEEAVENKQIKHRGVFFTHAHPSEGDVEQYAFPVKMSDFEFDVMRSAPELGEHTDEVLLESGMSEEEITALRAKGVL